MAENILPKKMPRGQMSRALGFGNLAVKIGTNIALNATSNFIKGNTVSRDSLLLSQKNFEAITETLAQMRGASMKLGQLLSIETTDLLPAELSIILSRLRSEGYSMTPGQLKVVLNTNWGSHWLKKFHHFEVRPFAAASIGQVHKAFTKDGQTLAIKVQFPNIKRTISSDLNNLRFIVKKFGIIPKEFELEHYLGICEQQLLLETNYKREAYFLRKFKYAASTTDGIEIPDLIGDFSTDSVLAMSFEAGIDLCDVGQFSTIQRDQIALRLVDWTIREIFEFRLVQTDPNFANYRYDKESGTLKLLDFGASAELSIEVVRVYHELVRDLFANDSERIFNTLITHKIIPSNIPTKAYSLLKQLLAIALKEFHASDTFSFKDSKIFNFITVENVQELSKITPTDLIASELLLLHRKLTGTIFLLHRLEASVPLKGMLRKRVIAADLKFPSGSLIEIPEF